MTTFTPQTKNTTSYSLATKHSTSFTVTNKSDILAVAGQVIAAGMFMFLTYPATQRTTFTPQTKN